MFCWHNTCLHAPSASSGQKFGFTFIQNDFVGGEEEEGYSAAVNVSLQPYRTVSSLKEVISMYLLAASETKTYKCVFLAGLNNE